MKSNSHSVTALSVLLLLLLALSLPGDALSFMGFFEKKDKSESQPKPQSQTEEPAPEFRPVPVPGLFKGVDDAGEEPVGERVLFPASLDEGWDVEENGAEENGAEGEYGEGAIIVPNDSIDAAEDNGVPLLGPDEGEAGVGDSKQDEMPVVFYPIEVEQEPVEEEIDVELDDLLFGASTDEAFLRLARLFMVNGEEKKAAKTYSRLIEDFPASESRFAAFYELGYLRYRESRLKEARLLLEYVVKNHDAAVTLKDSARRLLEEIESIYERGSKSKERVSIGALLPLEGRYEKMGNAALRGILLATGAFESEGLPVDVYVRDTGAEARGAKAAIEELVNREKVRALIGPMLSSTADEAAQYAQSKQTPIIALSQRDKLTDRGRFVFRNSLLPARQAALVASYAYNVLGNRTFVIIYPRSRYGSTLARAFAAEVERLGGVVINKTSYKPGSKDLNEELRDLFLIEEEEMVKGRRTIKEYNPTVEADALYLPDYYQTVSMVVPYLEYFNIGELQLLGSNGWNSEKLIELGGNGVEGAVFADGFFAGTRRKATAGFLEKYRAMYGGEPGVIESQAYDATILLLAAISKNGYEWMDRDSLRRDLLKISGVQGSIGSISIEQGGEVDKELFLLKVERGNIVEVFGVPESGASAPYNGAGNGVNQDGSDEENVWD